MFKKKLLIIATWGNIIGFFSMRLLGKAYDHTPFFEKSKLEDFFSLFIFFVVLGIPGAYFYAEEVKKGKAQLDIFQLVIKIFETACIALLLGIFGIILGRIL